MTNAIRTAAFALAALLRAALHAGKDCALAHIRAVDGAGNAVECKISHDGNVLGATPAFISGLETNRTYRLTLSANGYRDETFEFRAADRTPAAHTARMTLDSGTVDFTSEPEGATVTVNGVPRGATPVRVAKIAKGTASITVEKEGYAPEERSVGIDPGCELSLSFRLKPLPSSLRIVSVPEGARIYVNGEFRGAAPVDLGATPHGVYGVKAELAGFATEERAVALEAGKARVEEFRMRSTAGNINVITKPAGVDVYLDGALAGTTKERTGSEESLPLTLRGVDGTKSHKVTFRRAGFAEKERKVESWQVSPGGTKTMRVNMQALFIPDFLVITDTGREATGVLKSRNPDGGITMTVKPGVDELFPASKIKFSRKLRDGEALPQAGK